MHLGFGYEQKWIREYGLIYMALFKTVHAVHMRIIDTAKQLVLNANFLFVGMYPADNRTLYKKKT